MLILGAIAIAIFASLAVPHAADPQQTSRVYRVGVLASGSGDETFLQALERWATSRVRPS